MMAIHGVDFSGAHDAGHRLWISSGSIAAGRLVIKETRPASELDGGGPGRDVAVAALRSFIQTARGAIGLDFPFGLPCSLLCEETWDEFVLGFNRRFRSAEHFRDVCRGRSQRELRRTTDAEAHAPWAAWNWRLYRQTYYGISDVLAPSVQGDRVRVLPMQQPDDHRPWLLEVCPASTLKRLGLTGLLTKGGTTLAHQNARRRVLTWLQLDGNVTIDPRAFHRAFTDPGGDALDSIIATFAVYETIQKGRWIVDRPVYLLEGYVYR